MSMPVRDQLLRTFPLPFGRTLNARRAPEAKRANRPTSVRGEVLVEPSVCTF